MRSLDERNIRMNDADLCVVHDEEHRQMSNLVVGFVFFPLVQEMKTIQIVERSDSVVIDLLLNVPNRVAKRKQNKKKRIMFVLYT